MSEGVLRPPPPPPPPPTPPTKSFNIASAAMNDTNRSQLLADIRNGATLKKTPAAMLNGTGISTKNISSAAIAKKPTQDALQVELSNTLRRRKPVVINEPPKYEYPKYDESSTTKTITSSSSLISSNINNNDKESINNNKNKSVQLTVKPPNVNAVLSVVTGMKIPTNIQFDTNDGINKTTKPTTKATTVSAMVPTIDKPPKISHGKPNFIINRNDSAAHVTNKFSAPNKQEFQSTILTKPKPQMVNCVSGTVDKFKPVKSLKPYIPADTDNNKLKSYGEVSSTLRKFNAMKLNVIDGPTSTLNRISFVPGNNVVANKKALFEQQQSIDGEKSNPMCQTKKLPITKTYSHNDVKPNNGTSKVFAIHKHLNRTASAENSQRFDFDSVPISLNKNAIKTIESIKAAQTTTATTTPINVSGISKATPNGDTDQSGLIGYRKQMSTLYSTQSIDTKNFEPKTIVSFSKDRLNAPNMCPEQICVVKLAETKIITTQTHHFTDNHNGIESIANFQNIRFSIDPNAHVVPKKK